MILLANCHRWFRGSASEPTELQAPPAEVSQDLNLLPRLDEAEPRRQRVPRREPGNECTNVELGNESFRYSEAY